jgi:hypothetical protein
MKGLTPLKMNRQSIERRIIESAVMVDLLQAEWFKSAEYEAFLSAFQELITYYRENEEDDQISVAVVAEYTAFMRVLRKPLDDTNLSPTLRERIRDELEGLDYFMEEIIRAVIRDD